MKQIFLLLGFSLILWSCQDDAKADEKDKEGNTELSSGSSDALEALKKENRLLREQNAMKDSVLLETSNIFSEITDNLSQISYKRGQIRDRSINVEVGEDPKAWIMEEINAINELRVKNAQQVSRLSKLLKDKEGVISEQQTTISGLNTMVEALNNQIMVQDQENQTLKVQLETLDQDYAEIFDSYVEAADQVETLTDEVNTAYYAYGTKKELKQNEVITKEGSFIGIGGAKKLKNDFNDEYFEKIDRLQTKEITITGKKPEIVTSHPSSSYTMEEGDDRSVIKIIDPEKFWGASKYLVVVVQ